MDISEKTFKTIEEKNIKPSPKWRFLTKDYLLWFFLFLFIVIGSLAVSATIFMLTENDWDIYGYLGQNIFQHIFISMPYLWLSILLIFIILAYHDFKYTRTGYRYEISKIIIASILMSLVLGTVFFWFRLGEGVHSLFLQNIPFYDDLIYTKEELWEHPQMGILGGEIKQINNENDFMLQDFTGKDWQVEKEDPKCCNLANFKPGEDVELIGLPATDSQFFVNMIRPWHHRGRN